MSWFEIYRIADGAPVSGTRDLTKVASPELLGNLGFGIKEFPDGAQLGVWNRQTLQFDPAPAAPVLINPDDLLDQFTGTELQRWDNSNNANAKKLLRVLSLRSRPLNLLGARVQRILNGMAAAGFFDDQGGVAGAATTRPASILAFRPSEDT